MNKNFRLNLDFEVEFCKYIHNVWVICILGALLATQTQAVSILYGLLHFIPLYIEISL